MKKVIRYIVTSLPGGASVLVCGAATANRTFTQHAIRNTLLALLLCSALRVPNSALAQSNLIYGYVRDYTRVVQPRVTVTLTCLYPDKRTEGLDDIRRDPMSAKTDTNGYYAFTNLLWGKYQRDVSGVVGTPYIFYVGTNTIGAVPITSLTTNQGALPMNSATNYPTLAQVNALIDDATTGLGTGSITLSNTTANVGVSNGAGGIGTNATFILNAASANAAAYDEPAWYAFGAPFYGGQDGWPPNGTEQSGHLVGTSDGINWTGGDSYPEFIGTNGIMRDIAGLRVGATNYWSWGTTVTGAVWRLPLWISTNLHPQAAGWLLTDVDFSINGDSNRIAYCWSPTFTLYASSTGATNVLMTASVSTNGGASFEQRATVWNVTNFPSGSHSAVEKIRTGMTNCLDLTPSFDWSSGVLYFAAKDEISKYVVIGRFTNNIPGFLGATVALNGNHSQWGLSREGVFFLRCPDGSLNLYMQKYDYDYSLYPGHGHVYCFAKSSATTNAGYFGPWSSLTNCNFAMQNPASFKPIFLDKAKSRNEAAAIVGTTVKKRGMQWVAGKLGVGTNGYTGAGDFATWTNDFAGYGIGTEIEPLGGFGTTANGITHFYSYTNDFFSQVLSLDLHSNVRETIGMSNSGVAFYVPVSANAFSGSGAGLTNIPISGVAGQSTTNTIVATNIANLASLTNNLEDTITNSQSGVTLGAPTFTGVVNSTNLDQRLTALKPATNTLNFLSGWYPNQDNNGLIPVFGFNIYSRPLGSGIRWQVNTLAPRGYRTNLTRIHFAITNSSSALTTATLYSALNTGGASMLDAANLGTLNIPLASPGMTNLVEVTWTNTTATAWTHTYQHLLLITGNPSGTGYLISGQQEWYP